MPLKERELSIIEYLREKREASVTELSEMLFVSEPTVRRDLAKLYKAGNIVRTHGGAVYRGEPGQNLPYSLREKENFDAKAIIGKKCLSLINDGDTIMVDSSSTALALLRELSARASIIVVTNNAKAPLILAETGVKCFVTGGELAPNTYAYVGGYAEGFLRDFNADICFFSVRTLTEEGALTDNAIAENGVRRVMMANSRKSVLMLDSGKIGKACVSTLCRLSDVDFVVSESDISDKFKGYKEKFI